MERQDPLDRLGSNFCRSSRFVLAQRSFAKRQDVYFWTGSYLNSPIPHDASRSRIFTDRRTPIIHAGASGGALMPW